MERRSLKEYFFFNFFFLSKIVFVHSTLPQNSPSNPCDVFLVQNTRALMRCNLVITRTHIQREWAKNRPTTQFAVNVCFSRDALRMFLPPSRKSRRTRHTRQEKSSVDKWDNEKKKKEWTDRS